jgi:spoIIIJ-associated protein
MNASTGTAAPDPAAPVVDPEDRTKRLEEEGEIAADYLEEFLDIADLDGDIDLDIKHDRAAVEVVADDPASLAHRTGERSRLMLDIGGYRAARRVELTRIADHAVEQVRASGKEVELDPLNAFERKVVHDAVAAAGLVSDSRGVEPERYVVVQPAATAD